MGELQPVSRKWLIFLSRLDVKVGHDQFLPCSEVHPPQGAFRLFAARGRAADRQDRQARRCVRDAGHRAQRHEQSVRHSRVLGEAFRRGHPAHRRHDARHRLSAMVRRRPPLCSGRGRTTPPCAPRVRWRSTPRTRTATPTSSSSPAVLSLRPSPTEPTHVGIDTLEALSGGLIALTGGPLGPIGNAL